MVAVKLPEGLNPASLDERRKFYCEEFDFRKAKKWFRKMPFQWNPLYSVILGKQSKKCLEKYKKFRDIEITLDTAPSGKKLETELKEFLPESVYYSRSVFSSWKESAEADHFKSWKYSSFKGQELVFDIDPENFRKNAPISFSWNDFAEAREKTAELYEQLEFSRKKIVYSGRGFHVHVLDKDAFLLNPPERKKLADELSMKGIKNDVWVASGEYYLIRLPYSLHGLASRVCIPLSKKQAEKFNPLADRKCIPNFL